MSNLCDIEKALDVIYKNKNEDIIICQCTSQYPAPIVDINLKAINTLKNTFKLPSGFSDHSIGDECSIAAVALGAVYIERHFTLDRNLPGPDHKASLEPNEFKKMVIKIRNIEKALGNGIKKLMPSEIDTKNVVMRRIVASKDINLGEKINLSSVNFKKSNIGLESKDFDYIDGKTIKKSIKKNMVITNEYF